LDAKLIYEMIYGFHETKVARMSDSKKNLEIIDYDTKKQKYIFSPVAKAGECGQL